MFTALNKNPKEFHTKVQSGPALAMLMKALQGVSEGGAGINRSAGTATAEDRLAAMTPEERSGTNVMDKLGGLALTDQFRKRIEQGESDAITRERDKTLNEYRKQSDHRRNLQRGSEAVAKAPKQTVLTAEQQAALAPLNNAIQQYGSDIAGDNTQDAVGLDDKIKAIDWMKQQKFDILRTVYGTVDARKMSGIEDKSLSKMLQKRIQGNLFTDREK